ncbi:hypothetical protein H5410_057399 [Solanum commersonii]|uniref:Uncharacterized protein n=1 Tax=Solanum commersonii TaxID=4109 RepID=A0A9J5WMY1_SOLCO|nr:hypothetical protein H5410_057399 [Solanum commersonii]
MYDEARIWVRKMEGDSEHFSIEMELHQGSVTVMLVEANMEVRLARHTIPKRKSFKYLWSIIQDSEDINDDVTHHMDEMEACL